MKCDRARCSAVLTVTRAQNFMGEIFIVQMAPLLEFSYSPSQNCCTMYNRGQFYIFLKKIEKPRCESLQKARGAKFWVNIELSTISIILMKEQFCLLNARKRAAM